MPKKTDVNIRDIARLAGVSIATVSRVMNDDQDLKISETTRERVLETAQQLGYQPNVFAAALRSSRSGILGVLTPNLAGTFFPLLTMELQRAARANSVELLIGTPEVEVETIAAQLRKLQSTLFDGLLLLGDMLDYQATIRNLRLLQKPYVSVCAGMDMPPPYVNMDDRLAMRLAVDYLTELGHRQIGYLGSARWSQERFRAAAFRETMIERGLPVPPTYFVLMDNVTYLPFEPNFRAMWTVEPLRAAQALMRQPDPPTAVICANDGFATAAVKGALQLGLQVPHDVSILGHNDELHSTLFAPELTTVRQPLDQIAVAAVELLLQMIETPDGEMYTTQTRLIPPQLVIRETCAPPPD